MAQKTGLSSNEVANLLMASPVTVCEWMQNGMLHAEVLGVIKRPFTMGDVAQFARENGKQFNRPDRSKLRVLIVNSDVQSASRLVEILDTLSESTEAVAVHSTFDAGRKITDFRPDVVLVDSQMLRQESMEICRLIKSDHATRHLQIVAVLDPAYRDHKQHDPKEHHPTLKITFQYVDCPVPVQPPEQLHSESYQRWREWNQDQGQKRESEK